MIRMENRPLTEQDIITMREKQVLLLGDVQGAKRLLKNKLCRAKIKGLDWKGCVELKQIVDACFQIPDDNQEAAKGGRDSGLVAQTNSGFTVDKPPRKSFKKGDDKR